MCIHVNKRLQLTVCFSIIITAVFLHAVTASAANNKWRPEINFELVSINDFGHGDQVFYSSYLKQSWTTPVQISNSSSHVYHPAVSRGHDNQKWIVWTQEDKIGKHLYYSVFSNQRWSKAKKINTETKDNRSASLIVDDYDMPWLAWEGADDGYSDVFWCKWNGKEWGKPVKAHRENDVPDIRPGLSLSEAGSVELSWMTYQGDKYVNAIVTLDDSKPGLRNYRQMEKRNDNGFYTKFAIPPLPSFVKKKHKAALFLRTLEGSGSVPVDHF